MIQQSVLLQEDRKVYVVWNNKGGVGKSTIVFNLAARYAQLHQNRKVLVLDLCPQANSTMMFLGGGTKGEEKLIELQQQQLPPTIAGYLTDQIVRLSGGNQSGVQFELKVKLVNQHMPNNLWLVPRAISF